MPPIPETTTQKNDPYGVILVVELVGWKPGSLTHHLRKLGYKITAVRGQEAALAAIENAPPLLVIMGGSDGPDLYGAVRQNTMAPILALVPEPDEEQLLPAYAAGVDQYQIGPISDNEIAARAFALLRRVKWVH